MFGEDGIYSALFMVITFLLLTLCDTCLHAFTDASKEAGSEVSDRTGDEVAVKVDEEQFERVDMKDNHNTKIWIVCVFLGLVFAVSLVFTQYLITMVLSL